jgi:antirestriction protein ArdC
VNVVDIYATITDKIVAAIERGTGDFVMPWQRGGASGIPSNATTGNYYQGINIVSLWVSGMEYPHALWATYKQWAEIGAQVKKGEKATACVYYSTYEKGDSEDDMKRIAFAKPFFVFNASQVDGWEPPKTPEMPPLARLEAVDAFAQSTGAEVIEGGSMACYVQGLDIIRMPDGKRFIDTATSTRIESYYSTLMHELTHWTAHLSRLDRDLSGRFGNEKYAMEELVAELGAAFLCASLAITPEVRADHAKYINSWISVLKRDTRAIFTASAKAQEAVEYLTSLH